MWNDSSSRPSFRRDSNAAAGRRRWRILLLATCCVWWTAGQGQAGPAQQDPDVGRQMPVYRAGVELVVFNVAVLDENGKPVTDLAAEDFRLSENGRPQEITLFATSRRTPLDVALVLDASGSIRENAPNVREDAMAFLDALGSDDCVYFVPFRETVGPASWAAPDSPTLAALIGGLELDGGTALYDALYEGLSKVDRSRYPAPQRTVDDWRDLVYAGNACGTALPPRGLGVVDAVRRTAVVVLSDGGDEHSLATYADTLVNAWSHPAPIFAVAIGDALPPRSDRPLLAIQYRRLRDYAQQLEDRLAHLAHITGGRLILGDRRDDVRQSFDAVVTMLRSSYLVGYQPPPEADATLRGGLAWHRVEVETVDDDWEIFVRPGYYHRLVDSAGAEESVRRSAVLLEDGKPEDAVRELAVAARLDAGYWPIHLVRARSMLRLQQPGAARDELVAALSLRPGLGSVHALLAETAFELHDYELAWHHAIRAYQDDAGVASLLDMLRDASSPPADLDRQLTAERLFVDVAPVPDALDQGTLLEVLRALQQQVSAAPDIGLVTLRTRATAGLMLDVEDVTGTPRMLRGHLVINFAPYQEWDRERLEIADLDDPASVSAGVAEALTRVRRRIGELR